MGKMKKIKQLTEQAQRDMRRAELAAERAEEAQRRIAELVTTPSVATQPQQDRPRIYTAPAGSAATPAAAEVRG
jgi:hypothetical protein